MKKSNIILSSLLVSVLLGLDLLFKYLVSTYLTTVNIIDNFFSLTYVLNDGAAFSLFASRTYLLILIALLCLFFIIYELKSNLDDRVLSIGYSLALAGLLGNFLDRLIDGYIIDYLSFKILGYNYPIFNFADILIVVGIVIVIIKEILKERGKKYDVRSK